MAPDLNESGLGLSPRLVEEFMFGLVLADRGGKIQYLNQKARQLLLPGNTAVSREWTCCDLICNRLGALLDDTCLSRRAAMAAEDIPEVRMDIGQQHLGSAAWVTASPLEPDHEQVLFHLRPGKSGDRRRRTAPGWSGEARRGGEAKLQISTLGRVEVEGEGGPLNGEWLEQRPGQLFKYLLCERRRVVSNDLVAEALWPEAGLEEGRGRLRYNVHALRDKLEPERGHRSPASFILARRGGYVFDTSCVWLDVDEFEREACAGVAAFERNWHEQAAEHLSNALRLYKGDFLADEPYAEWALEEQERLRALAAQALRTQVRINVELGRLEPAAEDTRRLADLEPLDTDVQRLLIELCLRRGRRSEAYRRYARFRRRMNIVFNTDPDFDLGEIERQIEVWRRRSPSLSDEAPHV
ncbi:MAG TPA: BTAD domain-containing putative transcriptional regulator [Solirubrobacterales bacterium]|nr:BTAD domain-containing putative transcriptional regulator [Solirubrobacterales bacterium]